MPEKGIPDEELEHLREKRLREMEDAFLTNSAGGGVVEVTDLNATSLIQGNPAVMIDCWADWCGPCRQVGPVIERLSGEYSGRVLVGKCDVDLNPSISRTFMITAIPTILFFSHGKLADRITGAYPEEVIRKRMKKAFLL